MGKVSRLHQYTKYVCSGIVFLLIFSFCCQKGHSSDALVRDIRRINQKYGVQNGEAGILIRQARTAEPLFSQKPRKQYIPASSLKIITSTAVLKELGENYVFQTDLFRVDAAGERSNQAPSLLVRGRGDPNVSGRFYEGNRTAVFEQWAETLREKGIDEIRHLILDDSFYTRQWRHPNWAKEDFPYWYAAPVGALNFNDNCVEVVASPDGIPGQKVQVEIRPEGAPVRIQNNARTVSRGANSKLTFSRKLSTWEILVEGTFQVRGGARVESITVPNPTRYFGEVLKRVLVKNGITVTGELRIHSSGSERQSSLTKLTSYETSIERSLEVMMKNSQNFYAETLFKHVGAVRFGVGSWNKGRTVVEEVLTQVSGSNFEGYIDDGSGLSRKNRISVQRLVRMLEYWLTAKNGSIFIDSFPVSGRSGTMRNRLNHSGLQGNIAAKTGYLEGVHALAGYIKPDDESFRNCQTNCLVFAILLNKKHVGVARGRSYCDAIVRRCVEYFRARGN